MNHRTWIELRASALNNNIALLRDFKSASQLGIVIKGNAYGHGMLEIAALVEHNPQISWLFVAGASEAVQLRNAGIKKPILVLSYIDIPYDQVVQIDTAVTLYELSVAQALSEAAVRCGRSVAVHLKVDTQMSRLGVEPEELPQFLAAVSRLPGLQVTGLCTHLSDTSAVDPAFTYHQLSLFDAAIRNVSPGLLCHAIASGAIMFEGAADILRIGTNMFGFWKSDLQRQRCEKIAAGRNLEPVLTWKTRILSLKTIPAGRPVGYNRTFVAPRSLTLATVPVGYVDGYPRALSNRAHVLIRGVLAPVVGLVSMNMLTIDVSEVPDIALGDEVVLLGSDKGVTAHELAQAMGSVPNELTTRINPLIPRLVVL